MDEHDNPHFDEEHECICFCPECWSRNGGGCICKQCPTSCVEK